MMAPSIWCLLAMDPNMRKQSKNAEAFGDADEKDGMPDASQFGFYLGQFEVDYFTIKQTFW